MYLKHNENTGFHLSSTAHWPNFVTFWPGRYLLWKEKESNTANKGYGANINQYSSTSNKDIDANIDDINVTTNAVNATTFQQIIATNVTLTTQLTTLDQQLQQQHMTFTQPMANIRLANTMLLHLHAADFQPALAPKVPPAQMQQGGQLYGILRCCLTY